MYIVNRAILEEAMRAKGYRSNLALANALELHRNTIGGYLSGQGVFPDAFEKILRALDLSAAQAIVEEKPFQSELEPLAPIVDALSHAFPELTFILFGSRAKGKAKRYSDYDIGIFRAEGVERSTHRAILRKKDDLIEDFPYFVDLVDLTRADASFLKEVSKGWIFLTGKMQDWIELQRRAAENVES